MDKNLPTTNESPRQKLTRNLYGWLIFIPPKPVKNLP